jgi:hypothetical protein
LGTARHQRALSCQYDSAFGFDTRNGGPLGNDYAANHYALFRLVEHYVCITGDLAFLDEQAGPATVLGHLSRMALGWQARQTIATGGVLADFGADPWTLLECVPNYVNAVASFNAAYVGMTRSFAGLLRMLGQADAASVADSLSVAHESASGGLWGQAMEIVADHRGEWVRVAEDGVSNRDSVAGVAIPLPDSIEVPGIGSLSNINIGPRSRAR